MCHGDIDECDETLAEPDVRSCTQSAYLNMAPEQARVLLKHFPQFERRAMVRMVLNGRVAAASPTPAHQVQRLGIDDLDALRALYSEEPRRSSCPANCRPGLLWRAPPG